MLVIELSWTAENGLKTSLYPGVSTYKIRDSCQTFIEQNTARLVDANISFKPYGILHSFPHLGKRFTLCPSLWWSSSTNSLQLSPPSRFSWVYLQALMSSVQKSFFTTLKPGEVGGVNSTFTFFFFMKFSVATLVCRQALSCSIFSLCFFKNFGTPGDHIVLMKFSVFIVSLGLSHLKIFLPVVEIPAHHLSLSGCLSLLTVKARSNQYDPNRRY